MRTTKNFLLCTVLLSFLACQGPYDKSPKKPVKIGLAAKRIEAKKAAEKADEPEEEEIPVDMSNIGVGPVTEEVELPDDIDQGMADAGQETFESMCVACHKLKGRMVGPGLASVLDERSPAWVMNMILDPGKMLEEDPIAKKLLKKYGAPMADLGLSEDQARELVEYFRTTK